MTQALASDDTAGGSAVCCGTRIAIDAPSGDVRSADSVRSSASGPIEKSNSSTSCWRAMAAIASAFECITVVSTMSRRWPARMPCSRDVRSFVVETKRTLSPAAAVSAAGSDQPKLPLSKPVSPKPLLTVRRRRRHRRCRRQGGGAGAAATTGGGSGCTATGTGAGTGAGVSTGGSGVSTGGAGVSARFLCDRFSIVLPVGTGASATGAGASTGAARPARLRPASARPARPRPARPWAPWPRPWRARARPPPRRAPAADRAPAPCGTPACPTPCPGRASGRRCRRRSSSRCRRRCGRCRARRPAAASPTGTGCRARRS